VALLLKREYEYHERIETFFLMKCVCALDRLNIN